MCTDGRIRNAVCDLTIVDTDLQIRAIHRFDIPSTPDNPAFCQGSIGYGAGNRQTGSLLMTLMYYYTADRTTRTTACTGSEPSCHSRRSTRLLRIREDKGRIVVQEDNRCLGENNGVPDIPTARKLLKQCPLDMQ